MSINKLVTNFTGLTDGALNITVKIGLAGTSMGNNWKFLNGELVDTIKASEAYDGALTGLSAGTSISVEVKKGLRRILENKANILTTEINVQANGDLILLKSTGFPLTKGHDHLYMGDIINFQVTRSNTGGTINLSVDKPNHNDYGTLFAYWDPELGPAPEDINEWFHRHTNGHSRSIKKLKIGKVYPFSAAYIGNDADDLIWCDIIYKMIGD